MPVTKTTARAAVFVLDIFNGSYAMVLLPVDDGPVVYGVKRVPLTGAEAGATPARSTGEGKLQSGLFCLTF